jgi:hypothetical protein
MEKMAKMGYVCIGTELALIMVGWGAVAVFRQYRKTPGCVLLKNLW